MPEHRRKFSPQFRCRCGIETGKPIAEVARDLGVHDGALGNWVHALRRDTPNPTKPRARLERARVKELEGEIAGCEWKASS